MSKYLCLSFDDGPNIIPGDTTMNDMLDIMEKYKVPGSFFLIGNKITEENKKVIMRAVKMGCDIQNHSWTHPFMSKLTPEEIREEYKKCDDVITELTGVRPSFFRPPFVDLSQAMYDNISVPFICGRGCFDWEPDKDADFRYEHIMKAADNGTIFLLHVLEGNGATLEAVDRAIPVLKEQGYEFVNLPDLFEKCGVDPHLEKSLWTIANHHKEENIWTEQ
jgi:peptidoglycan/xylan/chitin deacetylase (PgdA/CDA1 family)